MKRESGPWKSYALLAIIVLILGVGAIVILSTVFHRAYVTVSPFRFDAVLSGSFQSSPDSPTIPYQSLSASEMVSKVIPATGKEQASDRASGTIVVYNSYSTGAQRLITNTRFQTADGLIYRVHTPLVVPGYAVKAGIKVPGFVEATVYADRPGEKYNVGLSDFTLPGLTDASQKKLIFAKSKTAMAGGFVGERAIVDPNARAAAVSDLQAELDRTLRAKILDSAPPGTFVFSGTITVTYSPVPDILKDEKNATVSVSGVASAPAFSFEALGREFARQANVPYTGDLTVENPNDLIVHANPPGTAAAKGTVTVSVSGTAHLTSIFDEVQLAEDLSGKDQKAASAVRSAYPGLETIGIKLFPIWSGSLPSDPSRVKIKVTGRTANIDAKP